MIMIINIFKRIIHPKWKFAENLLQDVDVCFFVGTDLEKFSITGLVHQRILGSELGQSVWESKQLIKHHNNPQVNHTTPVHQLNVLLNKTLVSS